MQVQAGLLCDRVIKNLLLQVSAELNLAKVPMLDGAAECVAAGVLSSIHIQNAKASSAVQNAEAATAHTAWPLLVDPQTGDSCYAGQCSKLRSPLAHAYECKAFQMLSSRSWHLVFSNLHCKKSNLFSASDSTLQLAFCRGTVSKPYNLNIRKRLLAWTMESLPLAVKVESLYMLLAMFVQHREEQ